MIKMLKNMIKFLIVGFFILISNEVSARSIQISNKLIETIEISDIEYVSACKITTILQGKIWQIEDKWIALVPADSSAQGAVPKKGWEIIFTVNSDTVIVNNRVVASPFPIQIMNNEVLVPVFILGEVFALPQPKVPIVESIVLSQIKDTTILSIKVDTTVLYETEVLSSLEYRIYLQALSEIKEVKPKGIVKHVVLGSKSGTLVALFFERPCDHRTIKTLDGLLVKCYARPQKKISTIVLDPGHGGIDPGAIGKKGLREKIPNLTVAFSLKRKLESIGLKVLLTRSDDRYVSLSDRVQFARLSNADLFVSIHCNAAVRDLSKRGLETYFLSEAKTDWERAVAARENAAIELEVNDTNPITNNDLSLILSDLAQSEFLLESQQLAATIQDAAVRAVRMPNRGVMQANFYVLRGNFMPAVLLECGYISNPAEEKLLAKRDYLEKIANGVFLGIKKYITEFEKKYGEK